MTTHSLISVNAFSSTLVSPPGVHSGVDITIQNLSSEAYVYIGGEGVTSSSYGYRLSPGLAISFELPGKDSLYATTNSAASGGIQVAVLKTGLEVGN